MSAPSTARSPRPRIRSRDDASILHADLDAFFASVEQRDDPALRGRPVVVGGGVVLAASYEAKACGVRTAMPGFKARQLCPDLINVPARFEAYTQASRDVFAIFENTTPLVEGISIDEAFLDVGGLRRSAGSPEDDRGAAARPGAGRRRTGHHRRDRPDQVPGQGGQRGGQTRRAAAGPAGRRGGLPASAAGREALGRRQGHGGEAARHRGDHGGRSGRDDRTRAEFLRRSGVRPAPARVGPVARSPSGGHRAAPAIHRIPTRPGLPAQVGDGDRRRPGRPGRPGHPADAGGAARRAAP